MAEDFDWGEVPKQKVIPRMQWMHGNPDLEELKNTASGIKFTGGFLIELKNLDAEAYDINIPGFTKAQVRLNGNPIDVLAAPSAELCVLSYRLRFVKVEGGKKIGYGRNQYEDGMKGHLQAACLIKGFDPVVYLTVTGTISRDFEEALKAFRKVGLPIANQTAPAGKQLDVNAFFLPFGAGAHETRGKGQAQKPVSPLKLNLPTPLTRQWLLGQYVGAKLLPRTYEEKKNHEEWREQWNSPEEGNPPTPEVAAPKGWETAA